MPQEAPNRFFEQIHELWILPEIERRRAAGTLVADLAIRQCLIKLPADQAAVVEFNEEVGWNALVQKPESIEMQVGDDIYLTQMQQVLTVEPPEVGGQRVAFVYLFWTGLAWRAVFDFTPNWPEGPISEESLEQWELGKIIADAINARLLERAVQFHDAHQAGIRRIGLWAVPALLPYPLSAIADACGRQDDLEAKRILVAHCTAEFLTNLVGSWSPLPAYEARHRLFAEALDAHTRGHHTLSINALVPQIEGVVTDWVHSQIPATDVPWRQESKTKKFAQLLTDGVKRTFAEQRVVESVMDFILDGPVLDAFKDWLAPVDEEFPNRHVVGHGKYDDALYTQENSIKAFLVLDTLFRMMNEAAGRVPRSEA